MERPLLRDWEKDDDELTGNSAAALPLPASSSSRARTGRFRRPLTYILVFLAGSLCLSFLLHLFNSTSTAPARSPAVAGSAGALDGGEVKTFWEGDPRENRLRELVADYDREKEGFGIGNANLQVYRKEMVSALEDLVGSSKDSAVDELEPTKSVDSLMTTLLCYLDVSCSDPHPIPHELFATAKVVDPLPAELITWRDQNPEHELRLFDNDAVASWIASRFPNSTIPSTFENLPMPILKYDLFRLLVLLTRGGTYTDADTTALRPIAEWGNDAVDLTDPILSLSSSDQAAPPPALIVGVEWSGHTERNSFNPLFTRSVGIVQWTFGASQAHPVILDATRRVIENSRKVAEGEYPGEEGDEGRLHFDPEAARAVLEWSGPAILSDSVARYLRTRWGVSLTSLARFDHPIRIGDVILLPIAALQAQDSYLRKALDWALGRNFNPLTKSQDLVMHEHAASWWSQKPKKHEDDAATETTVARERY